MRELWRVLTWQETQREADAQVWQVSWLTPQQSKAGSPEVGVDEEVWVKPFLLEEDHALTLVLEQPGGLSGV